MSNKQTTNINDGISNEVLEKAHLEERKKLRSAIRVPVDKLKASALEPESANIDSNNIKGKTNEIPWRTDTLSGSNGNYKGELTFQHRYVDGRLQFKTTKYRITRSNGQSGGNKANINILIDNSAGQWSSFSPDSMWQDGQWYVYERNTDMRIWDKWATVYILFIFDKPGAPDPDVTVSKQYYY